jgi:predicted enzyme related to lactoylglutathione lyase
MANIAIFPDTGCDLLRAKKFYQSLPGWKIEPDTMHQDKFPAVAEHC